MVGSRATDLHLARSSVPPLVPLEVSHGCSTASPAPRSIRPSASHPGSRRPASFGSGTRGSGASRNSSPSASSPSDAQPSRRRLLAAASHRRGARLGPRADGDACRSCARGFHHHLPRAQPACSQCRSATRRHVVVDRPAPRTEVRSAVRCRRDHRGARYLRPSARRDRSLGEVMAGSVLRGSLVGTRSASARAISWGDVASVRSSSGARPLRARSPRDPRILCIPTRTAGTRRDRDRVAARAR